MNDHIILQEIAKADKAINESDYETLALCYTEDAVLVVKPGTIVQGRDKIITAFKKIAEYFKNSLKVTQGKRIIIESGDTALVLSETFVESPQKLDSEFSTQRKAIYIYRKSDDGKWLCAIDNSYGTDLLNE